MPPKKGSAKALGGLTLARGIGPQDMRLVTYVELCALETLLTREADAAAQSTEDFTALKFILLHSPGNETHRADIGHLKAHFSPVGRGQAGQPSCPRRAGLRFFLARLPCWPRFGGAGAFPGPSGPPPSASPLAARCMRT